MNKDVIYIDVDDDITAIIGKIKKAKEKIVALVPPKRAGALQSAVNLRLLDRMARAEKKQLVLITNNQALIALSASAKIPVAKNLQTKPEIAEVAALVVADDDDIIDGSDLPVGDHAKTVKVKDGTAVAATSMRSDDIDATDLNIDGETVTGPVAASTIAKSSMAKTAKNAKKSKIPNFDTFRKRLFLGIGGGVALIALLIWMFVFAPAATVIITASTTPAPVSSSITLGGPVATDFSKGIISSVSQQNQKDEVVEFEATGQQDVGEKATGTLKISKLTPAAYGVPAGTRFTSTNGTAFLTNSAVTIPASTPCFPAYCAQSVTVDVTAAQSGTGSNGISGNASGPDGTTGAFQGATAGGTTKVARVVSADDIERAQGQLVGASTDAQKAELKKKFTNGELIIDSSFTVDRGAIVSVPASGAEAADGKAKLTVPTTYSIQAVSKNDLDTYLRKNLESNLDDKKAQKVYGTGVDQATISNFRKDGAVMMASINSKGSVGPVINEDAIKEEVKGKRYGEVQQSLETMNGIKSVDVQFSYFWVRTVPNNTDKVTIEFKVQDE
ncbi:MAG: uncharacterized protein JWN28_432 [Candidatus Saccharibacteria bacterium]|nr:uncharacterized protein [Candidatus Saccharibacteria bacterium]